MSGSDLAPAVGGDGSAGGETIDRILAEATKLKRKCKSLRVLLLETETKRSEEKEYYEQVISELRKELDTSIADLEAKHFIQVREITFAYCHIRISLTEDHVQLQHIENHRSNEMDEMANELLASRNETSMQGALIISMTHKIKMLEDEVQFLHTKGWTVNVTEGTGEKSKFQNTIRSHDDEYVAGLLERATTAEMALSKLRAARQPQQQLSAWKCSSPSTPSKDSCKGCIDLQQETSALRARLREVEATKQVSSPRSSSSAAEEQIHEKQKLCDQLAYYKEENSRLERQVDLIRRDLEARAPVSAKGPAASPRTDLERFIFRPSEKQSTNSVLTNLVLLFVLCALTVLQILLRCLYRT